MAATWVEAAHWDQHKHWESDEMPSHYEMKASKMKDKVAKVMREYKAGKLKSSSGDKVTNQKQAVAIAMSEAGMSKEKNK